MASETISSDLNVHYLPEKSMVVDLEAKTPGNAGARPTRSYVEPEAASQKVAYWGAGNDFPQQIIEAAQANTIIPHTIDWKVRALYGKGVAPYRVSFNEDGSENLRALTQDDPAAQEIQDFLMRSNFKRYLLEAITDFYWFFNPFPELILSRDRSQIVSIKENEAAHCRWEEMDKKGRVNYCYVSSYWPNHWPNYTTKIPVIDIYDPDRVENVRNGTAFKYIYPVSYPSPGRKYYQLAHWDGVRQSGWLALAQKIPEFKKSVMNNQVTVKYHVEVADWWWREKYPQWDSYDDKKRAELQKNELEKFNDFLTGAKNAGKSIMSVFRNSPEYNTQFSGWQIHPIEGNKQLSDSHIEDSQEASSHILYALGVDPTLVGFGPGKSMGAGSGSDKRVAFNMYVSLLQLHRDMILEPLEFIKQYNGWPQDVVFRFKDAFVNTADQGETSEDVNNGTAENEG